MFPTSGRPLVPSVSGCFEDIGRRSIPPTVEDAGNLGGVGNRGRSRGKFPILGLDRTPATFEDLRWLVPVKDVLGDETLARHRWCKARKRHAVTYPVALVDRGTLHVAMGRCSQACGPQPGHVLGYTALAHPSDVVATLANNVDPRPRGLIRMCQVRVQVCRPPRLAQETPGRQQTRSFQTV